MSMLFTIILPLSNFIFLTNPFGDTRQRVSSATILQVLKDCKRLNYTFSSIAEKNHISSTTVTNNFDQYVDMKPGALPRVLSIDEFYLGKSRKSKFACIFIDWEKGTIVDIYPRRKKYRLYSHMQYVKTTEFDNIQYVSIDINRQKTPLQDTMSYTMNWCY